MRSTGFVLREEVQYRRLLLAGWISGIGDWFNTVALFQLIMQLTHSGMAISLLIALKAAPYLLLGAVGGIAADRFAKKKIMILCDLASACFALSFLFITSTDSMWVAYAGTFCLVVSAIFNAPARISSIRLLVRPQYLLAANGLEQQATGSVLLIGSLLGGVVAAAWGVQAAFVINAGSFLCSGLLVMAITYPPAIGKQPAQRANAPQKVPLSDVFQFVKRSRYMQISALYLTLWAIGGGMMNVLPTVFNDQVFHGGQRGLGILYGAFGLGQIAGGLLARTCKRYLRAAICGGYLAEGVAYLLFGNTAHLWCGALLFALALIGVGIGNTCNRSLQMVAIPQELQGRMFALIGSTVNTMMTLALLCTGLLLHVLSPQTVAWLAGAWITLAACLFGWMLTRVALPAVENQ